MGLRARGRVGGGAPPGALLRGGVDVATGAGRGAWGWQSWVGDGDGEQGEVKA